MILKASWSAVCNSSSIFDDTFVNRRDVFAKALELVKKYYRPDDISPETHKSDSEILSEIKALESKIDNLIDMRAEGVLTKEAFTKKHSKIQAEIDEKKRLLNVSTEEVPKDNAESFRTSIRNIEQTLHAMSDFKGGASAAFMDKLISSVQVVNSNSYIFNIKYNENYTGAMMCTASGRRNRAVVNIDEITGSPDGESASRKRKNACPDNQPYRLQSTKASNSRLSKNRRFYAVSGRCRDVLQS